eukprot:CAMPEP_0170278308 /NCGR_PEP_ID=MMETSP0116_2-20130129/39158_1 /TAXON_ID=400756 /ORGANISM="Durinskia baltica, Strain CSIRO CS-38" /LENGTH=140 /DNA_ID=CAMNT_0010529619 /DNA_START=238 /DNA_END=661 /DNA_ORIENTATION=+
MRTDYIARAVVQGRALRRHASLCGDPVGGQDRRMLRVCGGVEIECPHGLHAPIGVRRRCGGRRRARLERCGAGLAGGYAAGCGGLHAKALEHGVGMPEGSSGGVGGQRELGGLSFWVLLRPWRWHASCQARREDAPSAAE